MRRRTYWIMLRTQKFNFDINPYRNLRILWQGRLSFSWKHESPNFPNFEICDIAFSSTRDMESSWTFALKNESANTNMTKHRIQNTNLCALYFGSGFLKLLVFAQKTFLRRSSAFNYTPPSRSFCDSLVSIAHSLRSLHLRRMSQTHREPPYPQYQLRV